MQVLTVHVPFGDYRRGDIIKDPHEIEKVLEAGRQHMGQVVRTNVPDDFFPEGELPKSPL